MQSSALASPSRLAMSVLLWVLRILMAALFLYAASMKLSGRPAMVAEFDRVGIGQWFRYVTGLLELAGGVAVLVPRLSVLGAGILLLVDAGAFAAQVAILHMDWIHTLVIAAILAALILLQRRHPALAGPLSS